METTGRLHSATQDVTTGEYIVSFAFKTLPSIDDLTGCDALDVTATRHREKRSLNANGLLWACIGKIAAALRTDKWEVYLQMLKRYGVYTYVCVKPKAVEMLKKQWRECEEIGEIDINGTTAKQMLCYYGSSTYDKKQFTVLLDGVISEMAEIGIETPEQEKVRHTLEAWGRNGQTETTGQP